MNNEIDISLVIPVYNGELTIEKLISRIKDFFYKLQLGYEVIIVYDCGSDNSWNIIKKIKAAETNVTAIRLSRNFGQHNALICGFKHARGKFIVTMDEDLQHDPADISLLIQKQKEQDFDLVYGKYKLQKHNAFRNITSSLLRKMIEIGIPDLHPDYSAYRLIKNETAKQCIEMNNSYTFLDGYLSWITSNVGSCIVSHSERIAGKSSYNIKKLIEHSVNIFITFSNLPIRLLTYSSFVVFIITIIYSVYLVVRKIVFNDLIPGFSSMMIAIGMGIGLIMLGLGIIGEYIYRINLKTTKKPNYSVKEVL